MTHTEAIKLLRDKMQIIYEYWNGSPAGAVDAIETAKFIADEALAATEQVEDGMVLPELPEGWHICEFYQSKDGRYTCFLDKPENHDDDGDHWVGATRLTPKDALLAAIAKIEGDR